MLNDWTHITFRDPWYLLLLLVPLVLLLLHRITGRKTSVPFRISTTSGIHEKTWRVRLLPVPGILRWLAFSAAVIALARPQSGYSLKNITTEGIDIIMALDISSSMYAIDFIPNRITAAKEAAKEFIDNRPNDRMGLVVFAGEAFTQCPITLDHLLLKSLIDQADTWQLEDGTALGDGLFMSVGRLLDTTQLNTKVIILLTDGVRTAGEFSVMDAAEAAAQYNIRVYTIGVGSRTQQPIPVIDKNGRNIYDLDPRISFDESTLEDIATTTGGLYFRADSRQKLQEIYKQIDTIEKQKVEVKVTERYREMYYPFAWLALLCLGLELLLRFTIVKTVN
jgi:Ca-activated chloride channel family protein